MVGLVDREGDVWQKPRSVDLDLAVKGHVPRMLSEVGDSQCRLSTKAEDPKEVDLEPQLNPEQET